MHNEIKVTPASMAIKSSTVEITLAPSWDYTYIMLGFAIAIAGDLLAMVPMRFPDNAGWFVVVIVFLVYLFVLDGWFRNGLVLLRNWYERRNQLTPRNPAR